MYLKLKPFSHSGMPSKLLGHCSLPGGQMNLYLLYARQNGFSWMFLCPYMPD